MCDLRYFVLESEHGKKGLVFKREGVNCHAGNNSLFVEYSRGNKANNPLNCYKNGPINYECLFQYFSQVFPNVFSSDEKTKMSFDFKNKFFDVCGEKYSALEIMHALPANDYFDFQAYLWSLKTAYAGFKDLFGELNLERVICELKRGYAIAFEDDRLLNWGAIKHTKLARVNFISLGNFSSKLMFNFVFYHEIIHGILVSDNLHPDICARNELFEGCINLAVAQGTCKDSKLELFANRLWESYKKSKEGVFAKTFQNGFMTLDAKQWVPDFY